MKTWLVYKPALTSRDDIQAAHTVTHHTAYHAWATTALPGSPPFGEVLVEPWTSERFELLDKMAEATGAVDELTPWLVNEELGGL